jgi:hypothetical protein
MVNNGSRDEEKGRKGEWYYQLDRKSPLHLCTPAFKLIIDVRTIHATEGAA